MKIKCEYCNNYMDESEEKCPNCNAFNKDYKRVGEGVPTTIEELKSWYNDHHLPPYETTRFFIGIDYKKPKAFGIYKNEETGKFIVYKNKDTGERKIRYEGKDEKYAVNELYLKLKEEILNQKNNNKNKKNKDNTKKVLFIALFLGIIFIEIIAFFAIIYKPPKNGYYNINGDNYYYGHGNWYIYENSNWKRTKEPDYQGNRDDYYKGNKYNDSNNYSDITKSDAYKDDWDSSSDWDSSDSWDSSDTDWSSDW